MEKTSKSVKQLRNSTQSGTRIHVLNRSVFALPDRGCLCVTWWLGHTDRVALKIEVYSRIALESESGPRCWQGSSLLGLQPYLLPVSYRTLPLCMENRGVYLRMVSS